MSQLSIVLLLAPRAGAQDVIIGPSEEWRYFKGSVEPPPDWFEPGFDDSAWLSGVTGIGYADGDDATLVDDMQGSYLTVFTRKVFNVTSPGPISRLILRIDYDDGFVAFLNGVEVARSPSMGVAGTPVTSTTAAADHEANAPESFVIDVGLLDAGSENVLAISVHNANLNSSDLTFIPELLGDPTLCPLNLACQYDPAAATVTLTWTNQIPYDSISIERDGTEVISLDGALATYTDFGPPDGSHTYSVIAVDAGNVCTQMDCTINAFPASAIVVNVGDDWRFFRGTAPAPLDWNQPFFDDSSWETGPTGIGYGDGDDLTNLDDMQMRADDPATIDVDESSPGYAAVFARKTFQVSSLDGVEPLLTIVYDDGFIAYVNGEEVGRVNMPPDPVSELTFASAAIEPLRADIPIPPGVLDVGTNVLAVSIHNANLTSTDLSFAPIIALVGGGGGGDLFRRGDADSDGRIAITDAINILVHLFQSGAAPPCLDAADVDDSGLLNITDPIVLLGALFLGDPPPPAPGFNCGPDPKADALGNCGTSGC
jgi:hypothetical protein